MQGVLVQFRPGELPTSAHIVDAVQARTGCRVEVLYDQPAGATALDAGALVLFLRGTDEKVELSLSLLHGRIIVVTGAPPSYLEWATVGALHTLGGAPRTAPPSWARQPRQQVRWWQASRLVRTVLRRP